MATVTSNLLAADSQAAAALRARLLRVVAATTEVLVLVLVCVSPWLFASVEPLFEFFLYIGVGILLLLWAARMLLEWQFSWKKDPLVLCLGGLFLLRVCELQPPLNY